MSPIKYIIDRLYTILCFFSILLIIDLILISSTSINKTITDILYMNFLTLLITATFYIIDYRKYKKTYGDFVKALNSKTDIDGFFSKTVTLEEKLIKKSIVLKNEEKLAALKKLKESIEEINDYITKWVHEIKIPLSILELLADKAEEEGANEIAKELRQETERINFLVNQVLYISRASSFSEDFTIEETRLDTIVKSVIKSNMNSFISKDIEITMGDLAFNIFTDSKWAYYVLEQIINNACKYVDIGGKIEISAKEDDESIILSIRDNGMGIPNKDIDRIFERGFIGENGRKTAKSTGMGLYISKKIADKLRLGLEVSSQTSEYTEFKVFFYKINDFFNVTKM